MVTFTEIETLVTDIDFKKRVRVATLICAGLVKADDARWGEHPYCDRVIANPDNENWLKAMVYQVAQDPTVQQNIGTPGNITDADIQNAVNANFPKFSKVL